MIPLYHYGGPLACKKIALYVTRRATPYETPAETVRKIDGTQPKRGEGMICGSCGTPIASQWLREARYM